ncbi:MAG: tRNA (guanine(10)-N(2))-dimethyltransferase [Candidatus Methanophagaceae archaeon]|nr:MAG: tRNA (guanine(10)-N(2))-dimethyltransferase [Methanophagales archaeon]
MERMSYKLIERVEGSTRILVPKRAKKALFYNPRMELCRDIDIAALAAFATHSNYNSNSMVYVDALAGTGVRGVRVANEVGLQVVLNDLSREAYEVINRNVKLNGIEGSTRIYNEDANVLLHRNRHRYDIVDIDPFGSPVPYLDSLSQSVKKLIMVTATDTAPLCGAHTGGLRKYAAKPLNTEYHKEMATRILLGRVTRDMCRYDRAIQPLLCFSSSHFVRLIARVERGAKRADECMRRLGFILHCFSCGNRYAIHCSELPDMSTRCEVCGAKFSIAGPLYLGPIKDNSFCKRVYEELRVRRLGKKREAQRIVATCMNELDIPFFYDYHGICKALKISPPSIHSLIERLNDSGFRASRTHFSDTGVKTEAKMKEVKEILKR